MKIETNIIIFFSFYRYYFWIFGQKNILLTLKMNCSIDVENSRVLRDFNEMHMEHLWSPYMCEGPSHSPRFKIYLILNNARYEGIGSTKKRAKINAIMNSNVLNWNVRDNNSVVGNVMINNKRKWEDSFKEDSPLKKQALDINHVPTSHTSAVSILHALYPRNLIYRHEQPNGVLETISVSVLGTKYIGCGTNKKEAKEIASRNALRALHPVNDKFKDQIEMLCTGYEDSKIIDNFACITNAVYQKLEFNNINYREYTVIASIIKVNYLSILVNNCFFYVN